MGARLENVPVMFRRQVSAKATNGMFGVQLMRSATHAAGATSANDSTNGTRLTGGAGPP